MGDTAKLKTAIYENNLSNVREILKKRNSYPPYEEFLSFAIKNNFNDVIKLLLNFSHINHKSNKYLSKDIAEIFKNKEISELLYHIDNYPLFELNIVSPITDIVRRIPIYKDTKCEILANNFELFDKKDKKLTPENCVNVEDYPVVNFFINEMLENNRLEWEKSIYIAEKIKLNNGEYFPRKVKTKFIDLCDSHNNFKTDDYQHLLGSQHVDNTNWKSDILFSKNPINLTLIPLFVIDKSEILTVLSQLVSEKEKSPKDLPNLFYSINNSSAVTKRQCMERCIEKDNLSFLLAVDCKAKTVKTFLKMAVDENAVECVQYILDKIFLDKSEHDECYLRDSLEVAIHMRNEKMIALIESKMNDLYLVTPSTKALPTEDHSRTSEIFNLSNPNFLKVMDVKNLTGNSLERIGKVEREEDGMAHASSDNSD